MIHTIFSTARCVVQVRQRRSSSADQRVVWKELAMSTVSEEIAMVAAISQREAFPLRPQRPHDLDQPFASMQRLSNSSRFASATGTWVPAEATVFDASN
jgi:hypothetical protein